MAYSRWAALPLLAVYLVVAITFARSSAFSPLPPNPAEPPADRTGALLSYASTIFGASAGWALFAADYSVYQPPDSSPRVVFSATFAGVYLPLALPQLLGAAVSTGVISSEVCRAAYDGAGVGGVLAQVLVPDGGLGRFGEFCMVVLALSIVANNCPIVYSLGFACQVLSGRAQRVPSRWCLVNPGGDVVTDKVNRICLGVGWHGCVSCHRDSRV